MIWLAVALAAADLVTTIVGVRAGGATAEDNGVWRGIISRYGLEGFIAVYCIGIVLLITLASRFDGALAGLSAILAIIVVNNLIALWRAYRTL